MHFRSQVQLKLKVQVRLLNLIELISFYESFCKEIDQQSTMRLKCDGKYFLGSNKEKPRCHIKVLARNQSEKVSTTSQT